MALVKNMKHGLAMDYDNQFNFICDLIELREFYVKRDGIDERSDILCFMTEILIEWWGMDDAFAYDEHCLAKYKHGRS